MTITTAVTGLQVLFAGRFAALTGSDLAMAVEFAVAGIVELIAIEFTAAAVIAIAELVVVITTAVLVIVTRHPH